MLDFLRKLVSRTYLAFTARVARWTETFVVANQIQAFAIVATGVCQTFVHFVLAKFAFEAIGAVASERVNSVLNLTLISTVYFNCTARARLKSRGLSYVAKSYENCILNDA